MRRNALLGSYLAVAVAAGGCADAATAPTARPVPATRAVASRAAAESLGGPGVDRARVRLPGLVDERLGGGLADAIDPSQYQCPPSTPVVDWYRNRVFQFYRQEPSTYSLLYFLDAYNVPAYEALAFGVPGRAAQSYGYAGAYTNVLLRTERDAKRFWDIPSADIKMVAMHGTVLVDSARVTRTYEVLYGIPQPWAGYYASLARTAVAQSPTLGGGNHPIFTFNAFAFPGYEDPTLSIPPTIVMGDGILEGYAAVGFADVAPQAVYAHEFGHQIQFANGYFADPLATTGSAPERTRYTELMADAYSAYYLTHKRGAAMNRKRVEQFLQVFFQIGDCGFEYPGHHGTPNQRMAAARLGFDVADQAQRQGHILTSAQFHAAFVAAYPRLVAPDAI